MNRSFETLKFIISNLVEFDDSYTIESSEENDELIFKVNIVESEIGKVIGKNGRVATSIRRVISSIAHKDKKRVKIEFISK